MRQSNHGNPLPSIPTRFLASKRCLPRYSWSVFLLRNYSGRVARTPRSGTYPCTSLILPIPANKPPPVPLLPCRWWRGDVCALSPPVILLRLVYPCPGKPAYRCSSDRNSVPTRWNQPLFVRTTGFYFRYTFASISRQSGCKNDWSDSFSSFPSGMSGESVSRVSIEWRMIPSFPCRKLSCREVPRYPGSRTPTGVSGSPVSGSGWKVSGCPPPF